ncbi:phage tail protein [Flavobacteriaceae bacterium]|nr:phage tail protein [Flavobacteriaceae bacterium]MDC1460382.1 phage tail protein [Flavobacteriaceae bacterium]|tara:strand:+ start:4183 stop:4653 length:471 start_codon:yes stop_codon:yes gene_type:complete
MAVPVAGSGGEQDQYWPLPKFYFSVDIGDFTDLPFQEVSGLDVETEAIEYRHGNSSVMSAIKMPGMFKFSDVTFKKGVFSGDNQFYDWISSISLNTFERVTITIRLLDEDGAPSMTWTLLNAFPLKVTPTDMNSQSSEAGIETIVFAHEGLVSAAE